MLRRELVDNQKLIGIISMPNGLFSAPAKKGSASKGADVKTSFLIFQKTNNGGTDFVWFYDMQADGHTLDDKRTPIDDNDIPDIIARFKDCHSEQSEESKRERTEKSFFVGKDEIVSNDYDLSINKYKKTERRTVYGQSRKTNPAVAHTK